MAEFVDGWCILETLGEGAFGEVKLLMHQLSGDTVAVKIIDGEKHKDIADLVRKEICIHRMLHHPNIIRYLGQRKEGLLEYIFLEYAAGGELFNKIEPDMGMPKWEAQMYFKQLLLGVEYLHTKGIAHRDIKPENLLLDSKNNLKITDFGMATIFRLRGKERLLDKRCGTLPYLAPEVLCPPYKAQPADLWSCGVVLIAMLAGELPWDQPSPNEAEYRDWIENKYMLLSPWKKLDNMSLSLIRCILIPDPHKRFELNKVLQHRWMQQSFDTTDCAPSSDRNISVKRLRSNDNLGLSKNNYIENPPVAFSQPEAHMDCPSPVKVVTMIRDRDILCFSQPTHFDDLIINSQMTFSQSPINKDNFSKLVCRMTRFFVTTDCEETLKVLCAKLKKYLYTWTVDSSGMITITTTDCRKMLLVFKANILNMDGKLLLDFRLSKGCGLEFKKRFLELKIGLSDIVLCN